MWRSGRRVWREDPASEAQGLRPKGHVQDPRLDAGLDMAGLAIHEPQPQGALVNWIQIRRNLPECITE